MPCRSSKQPRLLRPLAFRSLFALAVLPFLLGADECGGPGLPDGVSAVTVPRGNGFGGGTIYYPSEAAGPYGGIVAVAGYGGDESYVEWYGPLLALEGFVTFTINTSSRWDYTDSRADQLLAALDYLTGQSEVQGIVDPERLALIGWSMGGGGALRAALERPSIKAIVPAAPWDEITDFSALTVPTLFVTCQLDTTAPWWDHSWPMWLSVPQSTPKTYLEMAGAGHGCPTEENEVIGERVVTWMRRFVDGDTSASDLLCPPLPEGGAVSYSEASCPF